jgi:hypothetical protein
MSYFKKITSQQGYLLPVGDLIILLAPMTRSKVHPIIWGIVQARSHAATGIHIFIIIRLVLTKLDRFLVKYLRGYVTISPTRHLTMGLDTSLLSTNEAKVTKLFKKMKTGVHMTGYRQGESHPLHWSNTTGDWRGKCGTSIRVDEDWCTHDRARMRWKSSSSSTHPVRIWRGDDTVMTGFRQYKSHLHAFHPQHIIYFIETSNTFCEDMTTITHNLIGGFLQTRSVYVINQVSFSHKTSGIDELHNLYS